MKNKITLVVWRKDSTSLDSPENQNNCGIYTFCNVFKTLVELILNKYKNSAKKNLVKKENKEHRKFISVCVLLD